MDTAKIVKAIAREQGISTAQARADMIVAIHRAFLAGTPAFRVIFGNREPSIEEFVTEIARDVSGKRVLN